MEETKYHGDLNPFTAVWLRTRETVRYVIEEKSDGFVWLLVALTGIASTLATVPNPSEDGGIPGWGIIIGTVILGPIAGVIGAAVAAAIFLLVGKLFKGTGTYSDMFRAVATAGIPQIWLLPLLIVWMISSPETFFQQHGANATGIPLVGSGAFALIASLVATVVGIWGFIIQCLGIAEAHRFSGWKGFFTVLIPALAFLVLLILGLFLLISVIA